MEKNIILNRIKTPDGTILISHHRHDYVTYTDKNGQHYSVDGGTDYLKRGYDKPDYEELSLYDDEPFEVIREHYERGGRGIDGTEPLKWTPLAQMNTEWVEACIKYNEERGMGESFASEMYRKELEWRKTNGI